MQEGSQGEGTEKKKKGTKIGGGNGGRKEGNLGKGEWGERSKHGRRGRKRERLAKGNMGEGMKRLYQEER